MRAPVGVATGLLLSYPPLPHGHRAEFTELVHVPWSRAERNSPAKRSGGAAVRIRALVEGLT
jgi:hypothetical protein